MCSFFALQQEAGGNWIVTFQRVHMQLEMLRPLHWRTKQTLRNPEEPTTGQGSAVRLYLMNKIFILKMKMCTLRTGKTCFERGMYEAIYVKLKTT